VLLELHCDKTLETNLRCLPISNSLCPHSFHWQLQNGKNKLFKRLGTKIYWITASK
jgi:hypothetical protein